MKMMLSVSMVVALVAAVAAGNKANPDAVELAPLPVPMEFTSDMDVPVAFDATATVTVECPDAGAVAWLSRHFADWYGAQSPKVVAAATSEAALPEGDEAYAISADAGSSDFRLRSQGPCRLGTGESGLVLG